MAVVTLEDVVGQLKSNKKSSDDVYRSLKDFLQIKKQEVLDNLEAEREAKSQAKKDRNTAKQSETSARSKKGGLNVFGLPGKGFFGGILKTFLQITAGLAAVSAGILGWRLGWFKAVKGTLRLLTKVPFLGKGITAIIRGLYRIFGLVPNMAGGNFSFKGVSGITSGKLGFFGLLFKKIGGLLKLFTKGIMGGKALGGGGKVLGTFTKILRTVFGAIRSIARVAGTAIKPFMGFLRFGGRIFLTMFKKILWPIGILISAFDGVMAFMRSTESNMFLRIGDGIAGFMASFIGMPLNLLRDISVWVLKKFGFDNLAEKLGDLDFVGIVGKIYKAPFTAIVSVLDFIKNLFADPFGTLKQLWKDTLRTVGLAAVIGKKIVDILFIPINGAIKWIAEMFGWDPEKIKNFKLQDVIANAVSRVALEFRKIGPAIAFSVKNDWAISMAAFKKGWINFAHFFKKIPDFALEVAKSIAFGPAYNLATGTTHFERMAAIANRGTEGMQADKLIINNNLAATLAENLTDLKRAFANVGEAIIFDKEGQSFGKNMQGYTGSGNGVNNVTLNQTNLVSDDSVVAKNTLDIYKTFVGGMGNEDIYENYFGFRQNKM